MNTFESKAFELAEKFTLEILANSNNGISCCEQGGQCVIDCFNAIYDGIVSKLHSIEDSKE